MWGWNQVVRTASVMVLASGMAAAQAPAETPKPEQRSTLVSPGAEPRVQLAYRFETGAFSNYEVVNKSTITSQYQQLVETVSHETTARKQFRVVSIDEAGNATLEPVVQRVIMSAKFGSADPIVCDSDKPEDAPGQFKDVLKTINKPIARVQVTASGEMLKVTLLEGAPDGMTAAGGLNDPRLNFLTVLPKEPVGVGASWKDRFDVPVTIGQSGLKQPVTLQRNYEVTKLEQGIATISLKTTVITPVADPQIEVQLMQRALTGVLEFDTARGCVLSQRTIASKVVVGAFGPQSQAQGSMETYERWLPPATAVAPAKLESDPS